MTLDDIGPWLTTIEGRQGVRVTLHGGREHEGFLLDTADAGLYHVMLLRAGIVTGEVPPNVWAHDIADIEALETGLSR